MTTGIVAAWDAFVEARSALKTAFAAWVRAQGAEMPWPHVTWPAAYMAVVGLGAEDRHAWLTYQGDNLDATQAVAAERVKLAA